MSLRIAAVNGELVNEPRFASSIWEKDKPFLKWSEVEPFKEEIARAKDAWEKAAGEVFKRDGDRGSCIVGDGIKLAVIMPRKRKPEYVMLIPSREVAWCMGSAHYEATKDVALRMLQRVGLPVIYDFGRMD